MAVFQAPQNLEELRKLSEDVSSIAEQFHKLYYDSIDSKRHLISRLYMETAMLVWNGNPFQNLPEIQKFYEQLPTTSHVVQCVDSQLLSAQAVGAQKTLLIQTAGKCQLQEGTDKSFKPFQQSFIVTAQGDKWKIVSDIFRQQVPLDTLQLTSQEEQMQIRQQLQLQQAQQLQQMQGQQLQQPVAQFNPGQAQTFSPAVDPQVQQQLLQQQQMLQMPQQMQLPGIPYPRM